MKKKKTDAVKARDKKYSEAVEMVKRAVITLLDTNPTPMTFNTLHGNISSSVSVLEKSLEELEKEGSISSKEKDKYHLFFLKNRAYVKEI